ncbi:hypothetical protein HK098_007947 [Nowakowskiella sp. JEL0407]|nr:hypothetical protein HK098_007947 [Nowakowskiella sp. JEL0407]
MSDFLTSMRENKEVMEGDVFDVLSTLGDFNAFKEMILSYKEEKEGIGASVMLDGLLAINGTGKSPKK